MDDAPRATPGQRDVGAPGPHSALDAVIPYILDTFRREPALALTCCYIFVSLAGIYYDSAFYRVGFGIPVLTLSQIGDFLIAGLQQPVAVMLMLSTFALCWLADRINLRARRRRIDEIRALMAKSELSWLDTLRLRIKRWHQTAYWPAQLMMIVFVVAYSWWFVGIYAHYRSQAVRRGDVLRVEIRLTGAASDLPATDPRGWGYLGAVSNYVFVYDPVAKESLVLPVNAIQRIQPVTVKGRQSVPLPIVHLP